MNTLRLGVNIDHVATLRQARYAANPWVDASGPSILQAAALSERAGAHSITVHLREDRRHIQDRDVEELRESLMTKLNLEMANTPEIVRFATTILPEDVCLVPEKRAEITTEGGLDAVTQHDALEATTERLHASGIRVSFFIDPDEEQIEAARSAGADAVELHTGDYANRWTQGPETALERLVEAAKFAHRSGLQVNAGHGINYENIEGILKIPFLVELNIGHSIVARSLVVGLERAIREMLEKMAPYQGPFPA